jgi:hypothetical protein
MTVIHVYKAFQTLYRETEQRNGGVTRENDRSIIAPFKDGKNTSGFSAHENKPPKDKRVM